MSEETKTYRYGSESIDAPSGLSAAEVKEAWSEVHPELANADIVATETGAEFIVRGGTKGSDEETKTYRYGSESIDAPSGLSAAEVKEAWSEVHPELANADIVATETGAEFIVRGGTKGSDEETKTYRYGSESIDAPSGLSAAEVKEAWSEVHPELANADIVATETGAEFIVRGGTKG